MGAKALAWIALLLMVVLVFGGCSGDRQTVTAGKTTGEPAAATRAASSYAWVMLRGLTGTNEHNPVISRKAGLVGSGGRDSSGSYRPIIAACDPATLQVTYTFLPIPKGYAGAVVQGVSPDGSLQSGQAWAKEGISASHRVLFWRGGKVSVLPSGKNPCECSWGVNDRGQVVGYTYNGVTSASFPFQWDSVTGALLLGPAGRGRSVNNLDQVLTENASGQILRWDGGLAGTSSVLGSGRAWDLNDAGQAVGRTAANLAFRTGPNAPLDQETDILGVLDGDVQSTAISINSLGDVVGSSVRAGSQRGFLYSGGAMSDLNTLVPSCPYPLSTGSAISDDGWIVALPSGQPTETNHPILLIPQAP